MIRDKEIELLNMLVEEALNEYGQPNWELLKSLMEDIQMRKI